jgi:hypothetical protein
MAKAKTTPKPSTAKKGAKTAKKVFLVTATMEELADYVPETIAVYGSRAQAESFAFEQTRLPVNDGVHFGVEEHVVQ